MRVSMGHPLNLVHDLHMASKDREHEILSMCECYHVPCLMSARPLGDTGRRGGGGSTACSASGSSSGGGG